MKTSPKVHLGYVPSIPRKPLTQKLRPLNGSVSWSSGRGEGVREVRSDEQKEKCACLKKLFGKCNYIITHTHTHNERTNVYTTIIYSLGVSSNDFPLIVKTMSGRDLKVLQLTRYCKEINK